MQGAEELRLVFTAGPLTVRPDGGVPSPGVEFVLGDGDRVTVRVLVAATLEALQNEFNYVWAIHGRTETALVSPADFAKLRADCEALGANLEPAANRLSAPRWLALPQAPVPHGDSLLAELEGASPAGRVAELGRLGPVELERLDAAVRKLTDDICAERDRRDFSPKTSPAGRFMLAEEMAREGLIPGEKASGVVRLDHDWLITTGGPAEASMAERPGEQCKACGEAVPMTARDVVRQRDTGGPEFAGWARLRFPCPSSNTSWAAADCETVNLCPKCGERVAEYVSYCCAHPHARDGE